MILIGILGMGMMFGMPYLLENSTFNLMVRMIDCVILTVLVSGPGDEEGI